MLDCESLLGYEVAGELAEAEAALLELLRPADPSSGPLLAENAFERVCIHLELGGITRPGELSLYAFYARVQHLGEHPAAERR